ncbi:MAG TPA: hypothetical protein DEA08_38965 [Planctomycetes bacterium]|nr:hypothetical protein [Planctomycetota bacterium]|tara:strand:- start:289 stop:525 length:237 start_codon:yes stop_codon:yes gene_type:complete
MTEPAEQLLERALELPQSERARLVLRLAESLDAHGDSDPEAWVEELIRRADEVRAGTAKLIPAKEAFEQARERLKRGK